MDMGSWISAHIHIYEFSDGVTLRLILDNLRTSVDKSDWYTSKINKTYHKLAEHYDTALIPARVKKQRISGSCRDCR